jgi:hypothetical protein
VLLTLQARRHSYACGELYALVLRFLSPFGHTGIFYKCPLSSEHRNGDCWSLRLFPIYNSLRPIGTAKKLPHTKKNDNNSPKTPLTGEGQQRTPVDSLTAKTVIKQKLLNGDPAKYQTAVSPMPHQNRIAELHWSQPRDTFSELAREI